MTTTLDRRRFLGLAGGLAVAGPLEAMLARARLLGAASIAKGSGYGPLAAVRDEATGLPLLMLPSGFRYSSFSWTGDPMADGVKTPRRHDGMAAFAAGDRVRLIRNHELTEDAGAFAPGDAYDPAAGGGTTTLELDAKTGRFLSARASLVGTSYNCAGGPTPWGSWLTCEETTVGPGDGRLTKSHGWIFEVPSGAPGRPVPLREMGRFTHEAVAVDPSTGIVYETEDRGISGLYRFLPKTPGALAAGGRLEMLAVEGRTRFDTRRGLRPGQDLPVSWVLIEEPEKVHYDPDLEDGHGVFYQGTARGAAQFARLEGAWWGEGHLFFTSTSGGEAQRGQVWQLDPKPSRLRLVYESPGQAELDGPDNLCVSPRGGLVICEDGEREEYLRGLSRDGRIFPFARNTVVLKGERNGISGDFSDQEFAGACFSPDGQWLFVNIQTPGITFAITGPWRDGGI